MDAFRRALLLDGSNSDYASGLGLSWYRLNDFQQSQTAFANCDRTRTFRRPPLLQLCLRLRAAWRKRRRVESTKGSRNTRYEVLATSPERSRFRKHARGCAIFNLVSQSSAAVSAEQVSDQSLYEAIERSH